MIQIFNCTQTITSMSNWFVRHSDGKTDLENLTELKYSSKESKCTNITQNGCFVINFAQKPWVGVVTTLRRSNGGYYPLSPPLVYATA